MGTNIIVEFLLLILFTVSIINCQKRIQQGISWAFHTSIILSIIIGGSAVFMLVVLTNFTQDEQGHLIDYSCIVFWLIVLSMAIYNLLTVKKITITETDVIINPLVGKKKRNNFCEALYYTLVSKKEYYYSWKELTVFFQKRKVKISSIQNEEFVDIFNLLITSGVREANDKEYSDLHIE